MSHENRKALNYDLSIFGFMHEFWTIPSANMMYYRPQNYTNIVFVVLLFLLLSSDVISSPQMYTPYYFWASGFVQIYLNVNE